MPQNRRRTALTAGANALAHLPGGSKDAQMSERAPALRQERRGIWVRSLTFDFVRRRRGLVTGLVNLILNFVGGGLFSAVLDGVNHVIDLFARLFNRTLPLAGSESQSARATEDRQQL